MGRADERERDRRGAGGKPTGTLLRLQVGDEGVLDRVERGRAGLEAHSGVQDGCRAGHGQSDHHRGRQQGQPLQRYETDGSV
ncbi:hypothetical protein [Streptomyces sp. NPDC126514]|uniref:hypothetical protein n=1 Tax=Streptomyces sp. NPDC126514 TaxID=3155210 RepID=UPI00331D7977